MKIAARTSILAVLMAGLLPSVSFAQEAGAAPQKDNKTTAADAVVDAPSLAGIDEMTGTKVPSSVKKVIKKLDGAAEGLTLEDLNEARDASAKLDALLEIERKITDLSKLRHDREVVADPGIAAALPASALGAPMGQPYQDTGNMPNMVPPPFKKNADTDAPEEVDIVRIAGSGGRYMAVYKDSNGESHQVRQGDKMQDGSVVEAISRRGVTLSKNKRTVTLSVKDVGNIFGAK